MPFLLEVKKMKFKILSKVKVITLAIAVALSSASYADDEQLLILQRNLLEAQNEYQELESQLADAQGQIEELNYQLKQLKAENEALKSQALNAKATETNQETTAQGQDDTITLTNANGTAGATISKSKVVTRKTEPKVTDDAQKLYQSSYDKLMKNDFENAAKGFNTFISKYPDNTLTPNAWYWLGQIQFKQNKYQEARLSFMNTAKVTNSAKRPDALYKLGMTSIAIGDKDKAKRYFDLLIKTYPNTPSATLAKKELGSL